MVAKVEGASKSGGGSVNYKGPPGYASHIWEMVISYNRIEPRTGFDVATWCHEWLPNVKGRKGGRTKYLELAFQKYQGSLDRILLRHTQAALKKFATKAWY